MDKPTATETSVKSNENEEADTSTLGKDAQKILFRLQERRKLLKAAFKAEKLLDNESAPVLQSRTNAGSQDQKQSPEATPDAILKAVDYRLAISDLFVEKAQYHLEQRAVGYQRLGYLAYVLAVLVFSLGCSIAVYRLVVDGNDSAAKKEYPDNVLGSNTTNTQVTQPTTRTENPMRGSPEPLRQTPKDSTEGWLDLLHRFILAFSAYGLLATTGVVLARGARACLDQRERLLAKRHSLRQGRLYLHLTGGNVTIEDLERAFNWNHQQSNAFTHMPTDLKAPWGSLLEEIVKIVPDLVKTGVDATKQGDEKTKPATGNPS